MRIDFYILASETARERALFACRLVEKAYQQGHRLYVRVDSEPAAQQLDELLWTFRQGSFVPHGRAGQDNEDPVVIGQDGAEGDAELVLVNLAPTAPPGWQRCARLAEVVDQSAGSLEAARSRFRDYRAAGFEPDYHRMDAGQ